MTTETVAEGATTPTGLPETEATTSENLAATVEPVPEQVPTNEAAEVDEILEALMARIAPAGITTNFLKVMIYGDPGVGKTVLAATAPNPLLVDIERGASSLKNHPELAGVDVLSFRSIYQLEQLIAKMGQGAFAKYETLIIDSFSELQKRDLDEIVRDAARTDASRNPFLPLGPDYNINTEHMRQLASNLRDLDKHIVITCHVKEEKSGDVLLRRPNLTPKLAGTLAGIFDMVGFLDVHQQGPRIFRTLQTAPSPGVTAKTRIGGLPPVIENPSFGILLDAFRKGQGK